MALFDDIKTGLNEAIEHEKSNSKVKKTTNKKECNLERFIKAQEGIYNIALQEIKNGRKQGHWMWFVFPQIKGLGCSDIAVYYAIKNKEEAEAYLRNPILGSRLHEITEEILKVKTTDALNVVGYPDNFKLFSSMTLFYIVSGEDVFKKVLDKFFKGKMCEFTKQHL